jgi:hypothetical protein
MSVSADEFKSAKVYREALSGGGIIARQAGEVFSIPELIHVSGGRRLKSERAW